MTSDGPQVAVCIQPAFAAIPPELRALPQWVAWKVTQPKKPGDKFGKVPINPRTGRNASATNSETWSAFDEAVAAIARYGVAGVGFVFTKEAGIVGIDLDHCRDPDTGVLQPWAQEIVDTLSSYAELSPSGTGVHVLARGVLPAGARRKGDIEMYDSGRFFTITGARIEGTPASIEERADVVARIHFERLASEKKRSTAPLAKSTTVQVELVRVAETAEASPARWERVAVPTSLSDDEILKRSRTARNGAKFDQLWSGDWKSLYGSASEADLALCSMLAFWSGPDATRIDSLYRRTGLFRPKWDESHGEQTYGARTIAKALEGRTAFYAPSNTFSRSWRRTLVHDGARIELTCKMLGAGGRFAVSARIADGRTVVDKLDIMAGTGRARLANRVHDACPAVGVDSITGALEDLAAEISEAIDDLDPDGLDGLDGRVPTPSDADLLASATIGAEDVDLFHTPGKQDAEPFATLVVDGHRETWSIKSQSFRLLLVQRFRTQHGRAPSSHAITDGLTAINAAAIFDGKEDTVSLRCARHEGAIWIDLGTDDWSAVRVTHSGWTIETGCDVPVRFIRRRGMLPLPIPERGGSIDELRPLVNLPDERSWILYVTTLVTYLMPDGPYFVLVANGEQGCAKSGLLQHARELIDPNKAPLRRPPKDERDLMIAASNSHVVGFDNVSNISPSLSDALCCLATRGGFGVRQLYSDDEEKLFDVTRPVILNGIGDAVTAGDLLDRSIILTLRPISDLTREEETVLKERFEAVRGRVFGALLDGLATSLRCRATLRLARKPRMADASMRAAAAAESFGWSPEQVLEAIECNRANSARIVIEASSVGTALLDLLVKRETWEGTCQTLLSELMAQARKSNADSDWPRNPRAMRSALSRIAPSLRREGIEVTLDIRSSDPRRERMVRLQRVGPAPSRPSGPSGNDPGDPVKRERPNPDVDGRTDNTSRPSVSDRPQPTSRDPAVPADGGSQSMDGEGLDDSADGCGGGKLTLLDAGTANCRACDARVLSGGDA